MDGARAMLRRTALPAVLACVLIALAAAAQDEPAKGSLGNRYGVLLDPMAYPQKTPQETMKSIVRALDRKRIDYLLAQLADPAYIDRQVADYKSFFPRGTEASRVFLAFDRLRRETETYYREDPQLLRELRLFARDAAWDAGEEIATGTTKSVPARKVFLRKIGERWFLQNRQQ